MGNGFSPAEETSTTVTRGSPSGDRDKIAAVRARQRAIGRELRRLYDEVVQEPVPEDFVDLLRQVDSASEKSGKEPR